MLETVIVRLWGYFSIKKHSNMSQLTCKPVPAAASEIEVEETFGTLSNLGSEDHQLDDLLQVQ